MGITEFLAAIGTRMMEATGYAGVFLLMVAESMVLPVPSEAVMPFAGFLVAEGSMSAVAAVGFATLGSLVGSLLSYAIGRFGGRPFIAKYGKVLLLDASDLERADGFFRRRGAVTIFVSRFIPVVRHLISIPAGMGRMRLLPFCLFTVVGAALWNSFLTWCGFALRANWDAVLRYARLVDVGVLVVLACLVALFVVRHLRARRRRG
ncbi:MAG: DedA family protein [Candidatus Bipolaricaulota bacterium]|nr:DedA family protein [Candidatus Bipolaricaulota bacterium]